MSQNKLGKSHESLISQVQIGTKDGQAELLAQLRQLIPSAFLDGEIDQALLLSAVGLEQSSQTFSFTWPGINQARNEGLSPTTATLVPDPKASVNWDNAADILIEGDNLQVLKLLKNAYAGEIKLIYIDPPYNTGESFTYDDKFSISEKEYLVSTGQVDEHGLANTAKKEKGGRKHAPWLTMMSARLAVARHLLRRDGVFLASIDNNEVHHLRLLLDATFGAENFVDMITWRGARKGDAKLTGGGQDYVLIYARDREYLRQKDLKWRERKEGLEPIYEQVKLLRKQHGEDYEAMTAALRNWYKSLADENPSKAHDYYNRVDARGIWFPDNISSPNLRENLIYKWKGYEPPENGWRYDKDAMQKLHEDDRLIYPKDKTRRVQIKSYLHKRETWAPSSVIYRDRRSASKLLEDLMGEKVFDDPKSTVVLGRLFHAMTNEGDLILDFFAGSGSTGQAIWEQNKKDSKTRRWILVQRPEIPDDSTESGKNAKASGYKTIFEITAERLRRAAAKSEDNLGFRLFRARETNLVIEKQVVAQQGQDAQQQMSIMLTNAGAPPIKKSAALSAVVWEVVLKATKYKLDARVSIIEHNGIKVYKFHALNKSVDDAERLFVCMDTFTLDTAKHIGLKENDTLILRGDLVDNSVTLTLAPRLHSKLILLERIAREVSI